MLGAPGSKVAVGKMVSQENPGIRANVPKRRPAETASAIEIVRSSKASPPDALEGAAPGCVCREREGLRGEGRSPAPCVTWCAGVVVGLTLVWHRFVALRIDADAAGQPAAALRPAVVGGGEHACHAAVGFPVV